MQIGFVGLGKMGGNMVHRIRRDSEHEVVAFDFDKDAVKRELKKNGATACGTHWPDLGQEAGSRRGSSGSWCPRARPRSRRWIGWRS